MPFVGSTSWSLSAGTGWKTVYAQFDTDGNTSTSEGTATASISYTDAVIILPPPGTGVIPPGTGVLPSFTINNNAISTINPSVGLRMTGV
ncbi:TPA: hypothetical protein DCZ39_06970 [Patescibacteria group bacterium]|nr:hypothetical protein [Candidatus Gracilibacteria bacterium]